MAISHLIYAHWKAGVRDELFIAHRLSTIQDADKIVVIDHGEILEIGNHDELLAKEGKYYELYMTQFAGKEI